MPHNGRPRILVINAKAAIARALVDREDLEAIIFSSDKELDHFQLVGCGNAIAELRYISGDKLSPKSIRSVRAAIDYYQPDVVQAFYPRALAHTVLATLGMSHRPKIVSYRGVTAPAPWWSPVQRITYRSPKVDAHACESEAVRRALVTAGVPAERCHLAYNCLNAPITACDRLETRRRWGVPDDAIVALMTANMRRVKGADVLINAAIRCADLANLHVVLMGHVHDRRVKRLEAVGRKARVHFAGFIPDASTLVSAADAFVMPSRAEALSVALLEAMSQGVCPIVSDAGGMKEAVRHYQDGLVFASDEPGDLARSLRIVYRDAELRRQLGAAAARRVAAQFSPTAVAERLVAIYSGHVPTVGTLRRAA
jgi:glycosyltransferase involved in cell wall biosynthesis